MKTLRRPMFRKGGEVGGGIMTNINRENYQEELHLTVNNLERLCKNMHSHYRSISQLLIQGGLRGMSQTGGGGTLGNLAMAFEQPTAQLFKIYRDKKIYKEKLT